MVKFFKNNWLILTHALVAISLPLIWIRGNLLYFPEESIFANYQMIFEKFLYAWSDKTNYGQPAAHWDHSLLVPNGVFAQLMETLGISNHFSEIIFLQIFLFILLLSASAFFSLFTKNRQIILLGSGLYLFNFYFVSAIGYSGKMFQLLLAPLFFYYTFRYLESKDKRYIAYNFIALFAFQAIFTNLPQFIAASFSYPAAILYFCFVREITFRDFFKKHLSRTILFLLPGLTVFFYHLVVILFAMFYSGESSQSAQNFSAYISPLHLVFQFRGSWWEFEKYNNIPYNHLLPYFNSSLMTMAVFTVEAIALSVLVRKPTSKKAVFFASFFVFAVFLASGSAILPTVFPMLGKIIPGFYMFREPWAKFMPLVVLTLSALFVISLEKWNKKQLTILSSILLLGLAMPFFTPNFIDYTNRGWKKLMIAPPQHWQDFEAWSKKNKDTYVMSYPVEGVRYQWYEDNLGNANGKMINFFSYTNTADLPDQYSKLKESDLIRSKFSAGDENYLKIVPLNYVLIQKDIAPSLSGNTVEAGVPEGLKACLVSDPTENFSDKLLLYKVKDECRLPLFFVPKKLTATKEPLAKLSRVIDETEFSRGDAVIYDAKRASQVITERLPEVVAEKISPVKYKVSIKNVAGFFPLIFNNTYSNGWDVRSAKSDSSTISVLMSKITEYTSKKTDDNTHFVANGYANGWKIDPVQICGDLGNCQQNSDGTYDLDLTVEYWPQRLFWLAGISSITVLLLSCAYLIFRKIHFLIGRDRGLAKEKAVN